MKDRSEQKNEKVITPELRLKPNSFVFIWRDYQKIEQKREKE